MHVRPVLFCLLLAGLAMAQDKKEKVEKPQPTDQERNEIRELMGKVGRGKHPALKAKAAVELGDFGPKAEMAVPALTQAMKDRDVSVGSSAAVSLGRVGLFSKEAVSALIDALANRPIQVKISAAEGLGIIGPFAAPAAIRPLMGALGDGDADLRREAASALGKLGDKAKEPATKPLEGLLADGERRVRVAAAIALARLGSTNGQLAPILAGAVPKDAGLAIEVRKDACEAAGLLGAAGKPAVEALCKALKEQPDVNPALPYAAERKAQHDAFRRAAATALGAIGDASAVPDLEAAAEVDILREAAGAALAKLRS